MTLILFGILMVVIVLCRKGYLNVPGAPDINLNELLSRKRNNGISHPSMESVADKSIDPDAGGGGGIQKNTNVLARVANIVEQAEDDPDDIAYAQNDNDDKLYHTNGHGASEGLYGRGDGMREGVDDGK